jgi:prepilin-type N-terminal cleavage/methylation domain-containing protein
MIRNVTAKRDNQGGFTLIEILVALLILGIALSALAPAFYGALRAAATTNYRSVANGLAVAANEQLRSQPYSQIGYSADIAQCNPSSHGWQQVDNLPSPPPPGTTPIPFQSQPTVGPIQYTVQRCLYWAPSSGNVSSAGCQSSPSSQCQQAYKQSVVTVTWKVGNLSYSVSQTSAIYPGGEQAYSGPGGTPSSSGPSGTLSPPQLATPTASLSGTGSGAVIQVSWQAPTSGIPTSYLVEYGTDPTMVQYTPVQVTTLSVSLNVATSTQYYIEVIAINGAVQAASTVRSVTTPDPPPPTPPTCSVSLQVTPATANVNGNNKFNGNTSLTVTVTEAVPSACTGALIQVQYQTDTSSSSSPYHTVTMTGSGTMVQTVANQYAPWSTGPHTFTVLINGSAAAPPATQQITICQNSC